MMIDSRYGRTWMLIRQADGAFAWKRFPVVKLGQMPAELLARPLGVTAPSAPARK